MALQLAMEVNRREKRLRGLIDRLKPSLLTEEAFAEAQDTLQTYQILLSKLAAPATTTEEAEEVLKRLEGIDRQLTTLFDYARLETARTLTAASAGTPPRLLR